MYRLSFLLLTIFILIVTTFTSADAILLKVEVNADGPMFIKGTIVKYIKKSLERIPDVEIVEDYSFYDKSPHFAGYEIQITAAWLDKNKSKSPIIISVVIIEKLSPMDIAIFLIGKKSDLQSTEYLKEKLGKYGVFKENYLLIGTQWELEKICNDIVIDVNNYYFELQREVFKTTQGSSILDLLPEQSKKEGNDD